MKNLPKLLKKKLIALLGLSVLIFSSASAVAGGAYKPINEPPSTTLLELGPGITNTAMQSEGSTKYFSIPKGDALDIYIDGQEDIYLRSMVYGKIYKFNTDGNLLQTLSYTPVQDGIPSNLSIDNGYIYFRKSFNGPESELLTEIDKNGKIREIPLKVCPECGNEHVQNGMLVYSEKITKKKTRVRDIDLKDEIEAPLEIPDILPRHNGVQVKFKNSSFTISPNFFDVSPDGVGFDVSRYESELWFVLSTRDKATAQLSDGRHREYDHSYWICNVSIDGKLEHLWKLPKFGRNSVRGVLFSKAGDVLVLMEATEDKFSVLKWTRNPR
jgi:hypothetical protein